MAEHSGLMPCDAACNCSKKKAMQLPQSDPSSGLSLDKGSWNIPIPATQNKVKTNMIIRFFEADHFGV